VVLRSGGGKKVAGVHWNGANRISLLEYRKLGREGSGFCTELSTLLFKTFTEEKYILRSSAVIVLTEKKLVSSEKSELGVAELRMTRKRILWHG
jgi:hypothetical protein